MKLTPAFNGETKSPFVVQVIIPLAIIQIKSIKDTHLSPMFVHTKKSLPLGKRKQHLRSTPQIDRPSTSHQNSMQNSDNGDMPQISNNNQQPRSFRSSHKKRNHNPDFYYY